MTTTIATRSRFINQAEVVARALAARAQRPRKHPVRIRRVLLAHHLLLGDTLMLTPLITKLRARYPDAEIVMTVPRAIAPLYSTHPYGVRALPWDPRHANEALFAEARFDLAFVAGDNRYAWLAAAMHSRWIVAFGGDPNERKNWPIDELRPLSGSSRRLGRHGGDAPRRAAAAAVCARRLDGAGREALRCAQRSPTQCCTSAPAPRSSCGPRIGGRRSPPGSRRAASRRYGQPAAARRKSSTPAIPDGASRRTPAASTCRSCGTCSRMRACWWPRTRAWRTWVALSGAPTIALFGPGSAIITGAGDFWRNAPYRAVTVDPFPCRDQRVLFRREIEWVRRCARTPAQCPSRVACRPSRSTP